MTSTPRVQRLHGGTPILRRIEDHPWENRVTFNPVTTASMRLEAQLTNGFSTGLWEWTVK